MAVPQTTRNQATWPGLEPQLALVKYFKKHLNYGQPGR